MVVSNFLLFFWIFEEVRVLNLGWCMNFSKNNHIIISISYYFQCILPDLTIFIIVFFAVYSPFSQNNIFVVFRVIRVLKMENLLGISLWLLPMFSFLTLSLSIDSTHS